MLFVSAATLPALERDLRLLFIGAMGKSAQFACTCGCPTRWKARRRSPR